MRRWTVEPGALASASIPLDPDVAKHARRVLRLQDGDPVELRDGAGAGATARLADGGRSFLIESRSAPPQRRGPALILAQAVAKADKMDEVVRCAAELGVTRFVPFVSARTVPRKEKATVRWRRLAEDALRVSGRWFRMEVDEVRDLEAVAALRAEGRWVAVAGGPRRIPELLAQPPPPSLALVVGPEGGFAPEELARLRDGGYEGLDLGPAILRTQTAGHAVVAALTMGWGLTETESHGP